MSTQVHREVTRLIGLSLGGAKSDRTCVSVIDFYRKQGKAFLIDVYEGINATGDSTADENLVNIFNELAETQTKVMATDAPLSFPPCAFGCEKTCQGYAKCKKDEVKWMRQYYQKALSKNPRMKHFTPYTQRPVDLFFRYQYPDEEPFQDETMGANQAPQALRMHYLKKFFQGPELIEVWPKLTLFLLHKGLKLTKREALGYRSVDKGLGYRENILSHIVDRSEIFIYERDFKKIISTVPAFDSFICAWAALQYEAGRTIQFKSELPLESGWIEIPLL